MQARGNDPPSPRGGRPWLLACDVAARRTSRGGTATPASTTPAAECPSWTSVEFYRALAAANVAPAVLLLGIDTWDLNDAFGPVGADQPEPVRRDGIEAIRYALSVSREVAALTITVPAVRDVVFRGTAVPAASARC